MTNPYRPGSLSHAAAADILEAAAAGSWLSRDVLMARYGVTRHLIAAIRDRLRADGLLGYKGDYAERISAPPPTPYDPAAPYAAPGLSKAERVRRWQAHHPGPASAGDVARALAPHGVTIGDVDQTRRHADRAARRGNHPVTPAVAQAALRAHGSQRKAAAALGVARGSVVRAAAQGQEEERRRWLKGEV